MTQWFFIQTQKRQYYNLSTYLKVNKYRTPSNDSEFTFGRMLIISGVIKSNRDYGK